jgi:hypothetical protein
MGAQKAAENEKSASSERLKHEFYCNDAIQTRNTGTPPKKTMLVNIRKRIAPVI